MQYYVELAVINANCITAICTHNNRSSGIPVTDHGHEAVHAVRRAWLGAGAGRTRQAESPQLASPCTV